MENIDELIEEIPFEEEVISTSKPFIEANTIGASLDELRNEHIIPVFIKDNEPLISHSDFIEATHFMVSDILKAETILSPSIRLSHPIKGRIPEARNKPANDLLEEEKTIFYERMAFLIEIPSIQAEIGDNTLSLTVGGIKAYNLDNLYSKKGSDQHFKVFIGFQNKVCCNMCIWSDGYIEDLKVKNIDQLMAAIGTLVKNYNSSYHLHHLQELEKYSLSESQFAQLIGKCKMYNYLPKGVRQTITPILLADSQINTVCKDYFRDQSFCRDSRGDINLWKLYNLFTGSNKSSYIDNFIDRGVNVYNWIENLRFALQTSKPNWYLQ